MSNGLFINVTCPVTIFLSILINLNLLSNILLTEVCYLSSEWSMRNPKVPALMQIHGGNCLLQNYLFVQSSVPSPPMQNIKFIKDVLSASNLVILSYESKFVLNSNSEYLFKFI